jgi:hypothetical protein
MVLHARHGASAIIISLKPDSFAVSVDQAHVVAWDRGGRLYSVWRDEVTWRRGLSGHVLAKRSVRGERLRRMLPQSDADAVVEAAAALATQTAAAMRSPAWSWAHPVDAVVAQEARTLFTLASAFDAAAARADAKRFAVVYSPVGILPPDQYLSLVVQATEGCSFSTCTFCDLYQETFCAKTGDQFRHHLGGVLSYLGESVSLRSRGIFLGAANALALPMVRLLPIFEVLLEEADSVRRGVSAFVDGFTGARKTAADYRLLSHLGLRRVYVGLESGHDPLLAFVKKPGVAAAAVDTVRAIKAAGVQAGVIVMTGIGGETYAEGHVRDTIQALNAMGLGAGDLLYFSDLVEVPQTAYPRMAAASGVRPLSPQARADQRAEIRAGLRFSSAPPQIATYDIREFVY